MAALDNPRHEAFALAIVESIIKGKYRTQADAYRAAGYKPSTEASAKACASRLLTIANRVGSRVAELQEQVARRKQITVASIVDELEEAREVAKANDQGAAMTAATMGKAKIVGIAVDRTEQGKPGDFTHSHNQQDVAKQLLRNAGMDESEVNESCCAETIEALAHFNERIAAIVAGARSTGTQAS